MSSPNMHPTTKIKNTGQSSVSDNTGDRITTTTTIRGAHSSNVIQINETEEKEEEEEKERLFQSFTGRLHLVPKQKQFTIDK